MIPSDYVLDLHWFKSLDEARGTLETWRQDYNRWRPHSSLKEVPPEEFFQKCACPETPRSTAIGGSS